MCTNLKYCGVTRENASLCDQACPSGSNDECPSGMSCYDNISAQECKNMHYCGSDEKDAMTCAIPCSSGPSSDCPPSMACFNDIDRDDCNYIDYENSTPAPKPSSADGDSDDPWDKYDYDPPSNFFCGKSYEDSLSCNVPCSETNLDSECPVGHKWYIQNLFVCVNIIFRDTSSKTYFYCITYSFAFISPSMCKNLYYCGTSDDNAEQCSYPCPSGLSTECPTGMACYGDISAEDCEVMNYCGFDYDTATTCTIPCPSGYSSDCPDNMICFGDIKASKCKYQPISPIDYYCGIDFDDALSCRKSCRETKMDSECPGDEKWYVFIFPLFSGDIY